VHEQLTPCAPASPPAAYLGGKRNLAARLIAIIAEIPHTTYAEAFVGMGGIFFRRPFRARSEVINDLSTDVATLFRILQRHYVPLMDMLRWQLTSRDEFERLVSAEADSLTDLERAARFLYLQRTAFGGKISGRNFGVSAGTPARFDVAKLGPLLEAVHSRLSAVVIERLRFDEFIRRYDKPETLFYLDPPYWGGEEDYGKGTFAPADFTRLADCIRNLKGQAILSINDRPEIRAIFADLHRVEIQTRYSIAGGTAARPMANELIISNRPLSGR
jgi:DNA adenine methylase